MKLAGIQTTERAAAVAWTASPPPPTDFRLQDHKNQNPMGEQI